MGGKLSSFFLAFGLSERVEKASSKGEKRRNRKPAARSRADKNPHLEPAGLLHDPLANPFVTGLGAGDRVRIAR